MTAILNMSTSIYQSRAFQFNEGFSRAGLPWLCFRLAVLAVVLDPAATSLSTIITAVVTWTATWMFIA